MGYNKNKWLLPSVKNIKVFKNWPQGSALSVAGGIIIPWLSQSTPSGHYSRAATDPLADRSWAPLSGTQRGAERSTQERGTRGTHWPWIWGKGDGAGDGTILMWRFLGPHPGLEGAHLGQVLVVAGVCWQRNIKPNQEHNCIFFHLLFIWCIYSL